MACQGHPQTLYTVCKQTAVSYGSVQRRTGCSQPVPKLSTSFHLTADRLTNDLTNDISPNHHILIISSALISSEQDLLAACHPSREYTCEPVPWCLPDTRRPSLRPCPHLHGFALFGPALLPRRLAFHSAQLADIPQLCQHSLHASSRKVAPCSRLKWELLKLHLEGPASACQGSHCALRSGGAVAQPPAPPFGKVGHAHHSGCLHIMKFFRQFMGLCKMLCTAEQQQSCCLTCCTDSAEATPPANAATP